MLDAALALHALIDWQGVEHLLRRPPRRLDDPGAQRWFVWISTQLVDGSLQLKEGLGIASYPYMAGVDRHTPTPQEKESYDAVPAHLAGLPEPAGGGGPTQVEERVALPP